MELKLMISIAKPVGALKNNERNSPPDVRKVQGLINKNLHLLTCTNKLAIDGSIGKIEKSNTIKAINAFQLKVVKMARPDGRVDPRGDTLRKLNANARKTRPANVSAFVKKVLADAKKIKLKYKIPVSILIAQAALESGWGRSVKDNAYFGIKSHNSKGAATVFTTTEVINGKKVTIKDSFRAYANFGEAAEGYGKFLTTQPRYKPAFLYINNPSRFAEALQNAGYATDPQYAKKLKTIISTYYLDEYDN